MTIAPIPTEADEGRHGAKSLKTRLYRALRDAVKARGLSDSAASTGEALIAFIPADAPAPISPVQVQRLADDRRCDPRTVRAHIAQLVDRGLVTDATKGSGARGLVRNAAGRIASLWGVNFAPLDALAEVLAEEAEAFNRLNTEKARLRGAISAVRRRIKRQFDAVPPSDQERVLFDRFPRRIAHLDLENLDSLLSRLEDFVEAVRQRRQEDIGGPSQDTQAGTVSVDSSDRSEDSNRPLYITTGSNNRICNRNAINNARQSSKCSAEPRRLCGLEHVRLGMALDAAPKEWGDALSLYERPGWQDLSAVAYDRAPRLGISPSAMAHAHEVIGRTATTILVLIADANRIERGGTIRNAGAWLRAMTDRVAAGEAQLHRSIFGILDRPKLPTAPRRRPV